MQFSVRFGHILSFFAPKLKPRKSLKAALHQFEPATKFSENGADEKKRVFFLGDSAARGLDTSMKVVAEELVHIGST